MNAAILIRLAYIFFSFKKELTFVLSIFLFLLLMPIIGIFVLTNTGIKAVSDTLIHVDAQTHAIELLYPDGKLYKTLQLDTEWPVQGVITLGFGESDLPYQVLHTGIDIANPNGKIGDPIVPVMPGKVTHVGHLSWGYGEHVIIDHGDNITSVYGHLSKINVQEGDEVKMGTVIAEEGQTGWATGPHLHFETRVWGIPVNPKLFLQ